ncbi:MAG: Crp/Fnr family transcriptional regulator [Candidatus Marinimicrobia bacterium]|nr:Crp/Fnr family transcriptional regulator [Candidatus Neomarinimicrobiota bacterium]
MTTYELLARNDLFRGLEGPEVRALLEEISYQRNIYQKGDTIVRDGEPVTGQYILLRGSVRGEMVNYSGKVIKIEDVEGNQLLAPAFLFGQDTCYPVDVIANRESECIYFNKISFIRLLQMNKTVLTNHLNIMSGRAQFLSEKIKFLSFQTIKGKIAHYLLKQAQRKNTLTVELPYSHEKLADLFGVTRPSLTRELRELDKEKIISARGRSIRILDKTRLSRLVQ